MLFYRLGSESCYPKAESTGKHPTLSCASHLSLRTNWRALGIFRSKAGSKTTSRSARNRFVRTRSALTRECLLQFRSEFRDQHCSRQLASKRCTLPGPLSAESRLTRGLRGSVQRLACIVCEWIVRNGSAFEERDVVVRALRSRKTGNALTRPCTTTGSSGDIILSSGGTGRCSTWFKWRATSSGASRSYHIVNDHNLVMERSARATCI